MRVPLRGNGAAFGDLRSTGSDLLHKCPSEPDITPAEISGISSWSATAVSLRLRREAHERRATMRIGTFAKALGVSIDTVRRAEQRGLLTPARDWAGQRRYTETDLQQARA